MELFKTIPEVETKTSKTCNLAGYGRAAGNSGIGRCGSFGGAADQIKIVCKSGTQKHTEERYRAVGGTLPCKDQLTQRGKRIN